ncbi:MAG: site-2 protease family protein [Spirochaetota bacterium]
MLTNKIKLFKIFGFTVSIDISWFFLLIIVTWSLASGFFPGSYRGLSTLTYWIMGIAGAFGLFASITLHELAHSFVARRYGIPMRGITLFLFGGVAEAGDEPPDPEAELKMSVAGPAASISLGAIFFALSLPAKTGAPVALFGVLRYLAFINGLLALFNLIPAFPLDGGRVLRSFIWRRKRDLREATRITSTIGRAFSFVLIAFGVFNLFLANFVAGMWWFIIGLFLNNAARMSYRQVLIRSFLKGESVYRFMKTNPVVVPHTTSLRELVDEYIYRHHYKMFPVVDGDRLIGCVTMKQLGDIPREEWGSHTVAELVQRCSRENSVKPDEDAAKVLSHMNRTGRSRLMVVDDNRLVGVITLKDMLEHISLRMELEKVGE